MSRRISSLVFVGREEELEALAAALARAAAGEAAMVLVGGESFAADEEECVRVAEL